MLEGLAPADFPTQVRVITVVDGEDSKFYVYLGDDLIIPSDEDTTSVCQYWLEKRAIELGKALGTGIPKFETYRVKRVLIRGD